MQLALCTYVSQVPRSSAVANAMCIVVTLPNCKWLDKFTLNFEELSCVQSDTSTASGMHLRNVTASAICTRKFQVHSSTNTVSTRKSQLDPALHSTISITVSSCTWKSQLGPALHFMILSGDPLPFEISVRCAWH